MSSTISFKGFLLNGGFSISLVLDYVQVTSMSISQPHNLDSKVL